jgi:outer membrane protein assembly factor BamB
MNRLFSCARLLSIGLAILGTCFAADWPGWRGSARDGHTSDPLPAALATDPRPLWRKSLGHGYASPVVTGRRVIVLDDSQGQETARCLDAATGQELWATPFGELYRDEFEAGPRCTPLVEDDRVYVQSCYGQFACLNATNGALRWTFHFRDHGAFWVKEKGGGVGAANRRGHSGSPVIDGDRIIVQVGSTNGASLCAFDKFNGRLLWKSQNDLTCYASLVSATLGGRRQAVAVTCDGLLGVSVADGAPLWRVPFRTGANRNVVTPLIEGDTVTFASFTTGLRRLRIHPAGEAQEARDDWFNRDLKINLSTPVLVAGHLYGHGPDKDFICVDAATGSLRWRQTGFDQYASTIASGERLLVQNDQGEVLLLTATPAKYTELGRFQASGKTFSHPAYAGGVLYVRDPKEIVAWRLTDPLP